MMGGILLKRMREFYLSPTLPGINSYDQEAARI